MPLISAPWSASINTTVDSQAPGNLNLTIGMIGATTAMSTPISR
ncbi:MAG: hypothetical protein M5U34_03605 [Chloroflexi bacterium]|nr:hypothetical protein [Chloroflexota bacterium]